MDHAVLVAHRERQERFRREGYFSGLRIVKALDVLDAEFLRGANVLDIGAGECLLSEALAFAMDTEQVWALDAVPKQIWAAAEQHPDSERLKFVLADASDSPFADGSFDLVVANLVLHHVEPLQPLAREAIRVLRPGGILAAFEPNPIVEHVVDLVTRRKTSENEGLLTRGRAENALRDVGFESVKSGYWWSRFETQRMQALSPGIRFFATKPGSGVARGRPVSFRRDLTPMALKGLAMDSTCRFADLALRQETEILGLLGDIDGRRGTIDPGAKL
ncbi:MAG: class I SAM-dependent methyltransferase [Actinomycetota bacterium]|nr:class I SAM-dependent methyltransferase [Actinomycetota bacterium]